MSDSTARGTPAEAETPSRNLPRSVLDHLREGCQVIGPDYRYLYVNDAAVRQGKATRDALLGRTMMEYDPGIETTQMFSLLRACMEQRSPATMENEVTFPDGSKGWFELRFEPVPEGVAILSVDITDRKRAEIALRRTLRTLTTLSRCNQTLVRAIHEQRLVEDVCDLLIDSGAYRAARIALCPTGSSDQGEEVELASAGDRDAGREANSTLSLAIRSGGCAIGTLTVCAGEPHAFDPDERAVLEELALDLGYGIQALRARITDARTQDELNAAQRLEAVGRLAGGVAHDFNNLLSVILTYAGFAAEQLQASDPIREDIEQVREAGVRAAALTRQLLAFSRKQIMEPQVTRLNQVIGGIESMLQRLLGADVDLQVHPASDLGTVMADPGQLEQVILNLAANARDAMPDGGTLTIETENVELGENDAEEHASLKPGLYVRVTVTDTGTGMSAETRRRIFEPFFTTKGKGSGIGLGLSTVYGIVTQSGGDIRVYSEPGHGTTFKIDLPRADCPAVARKRTSSCPR